jgi:RimJ/RimL family protein N-acetyltransferase
MLDTLSGSGAFYGIYTRGGRAIGYIGAALDDRDMRACVYIAIGEEDARGQGYGTEAMRVLLRHLFTDLGYHRAYLFVHETNPRAIRSYEKCGFVIEGHLREHVRYERGYGTELVMGVLAEEFARLDI